MAWNTEELRNPALRKFFSKVFGSSDTDYAMELSGGVRIFTGAAIDVAAVFAEVGTKDAVGSIYLSTAGLLFVQVANTGAATDWKAVASVA